MFTLIYSNYPELSVYPSRVLASKQSQTLRTDTHLTLSTVMSLDASTPVSSLRYLLYPVRLLVLSRRTSPSLYEILYV